MIYKIIIGIYIFLLMVDSAYVAYGLNKKKNMWSFICAYWILLAGKNVIDFVYYVGSK